jgi:hypothetical protein
MRYFFTVTGVALFSVLLLNNAQAVITFDGVDYEDTNNLVFNGDFELVDRLAGDFNGDTFADDADLAQWEDDFGLNGESDADNDGDSDGNDFLLWQRTFGGDPIQPSPSGWFRGADQTDVNHVVDQNPANAFSGSVSVGYDTTIDSNQFNPATWADWRASSISLGDLGIGQGARMLLQFNYQMNSTVTPDGEILAESREFGDELLTAFIPGTGFSIISQDPDNPEDNPNIMVDPTNANWFLVQQSLEVQADNSFLDLRFNQIFTFGAPLVPWQGEFRLDNVSIFTEVVPALAVSPVPEPTALALTTLGAALLSLSRRRN